jgi:hypothetical protein
MARISVFETEFSRRRLCASTAAKRLTRRHIGAIKIMEFGLPTEIVAEGMRVAQLAGQ